jgi:NAD(P)-dependent dehydrogenase (short-subunit alcohol dehydrogenase family)
MATKTWFITGCSTGFGRALAELLLERGENVAVSARRPETIADLVEPHGERALALKLDITKPTEVESAVAEARGHFGRIDVLVNNAGYGHFGPIELAPIEDARAVMETNYFGTVAMIRAVLPEMIARRSGQIVNIGSVAGNIGFPALGYYCATKFAISGLTESLGAELAPLGINVTIAELGPFATEFNNSMTFIPPAEHYDMAALSRHAGNADWVYGDPRDAAEALVDALADPAPPHRLILGQTALDTIRLHDSRRMEERERWMDVTLKAQLLAAE